MRNHVTIFPSIIIATLLLTACANYAKTQPEGTSATTSSETFQNAAKALVDTGYCAPEFRSCGCSLDGIQTSCFVVEACLRNGFCEIAR